MTDLPPLEVVVVAYGPPGPLADCLAAVDASAVSLVVVDNSSLPETRRLVEANQGRYLDPGANLGFAAGVNYALRHGHRADADVLLLNPDAVAAPSAVAELRRRLHRDPALGAVAPAQIDPVSGEPARVVWPVPTPGGAWLDAVGLGSQRRGRRQFLIGSVLLLRAEALADVGPLDERFFLYAEETDWQIRALARGWKLALCPEVVASHTGGGTGGDPTRRETHFHASQERLVRKHYGELGWAVYRLAAITGALARALARKGSGAARDRLHLYLAGPGRCERDLLAGAAEGKGDRG